MSKDSDSPGCCGFVLIGVGILIVISIVKAIIEGIAAIVKAIVEAITAFFQALFAGIAIGFMGAASSLVTLVIAGLILFKWDDPWNAKDGFELKTPNLILLNATAVASLILHGVLLFSTEFFAQETALWVFGINLSLVLAAALPVTLVSLATRSRVVRRAQDARLSEERQVAEKRQREEEAQRRAEEQRNKAEQRQAYLEARELGTVIDKIAATQTALDGRRAAAAQQRQNVEEQLQRLSGKVGREQMVEQLRQDAETLTQFETVADRLYQSMESRRLTLAAELHLTQTIRNLPEQVQMPDVTEIRTSKDAGLTRKQLASVLAELRSAHEAVVTRKREFEESFAPQEGSFAATRARIMGRYDGLAELLDERADTAALCDSRLATVEIVKTEGLALDDAQAQEPSTVLSADLDAMLIQLQDSVSDDALALAGAELIDCDSDLALLERIDMKLSSSNEALEEVEELLSGWSVPEAKEEPAEVVTAKT